MKRAARARPSSRLLAAGLVAFAMLPASVPAVRAGTPEDTVGAKEPAPPAEHLPKAQSGQIALPVHPREPRVSTLARRLGPPPAPHLLDQFEFAFLVGGAHPTGHGADQVSDGTQMGLQAAYYPSPRQAFGVTYVHFGMDSPDGSRSNSVQAVNELSFFGKALLSGGDGLSPYLRVSSGFYTTRRFATHLTGAPGSDGSYEEEVTGLGLGAGLGLQLRTGTPVGWFLEARYAGDMLGAHRHSALVGLRGGMSLILGGHRGAR